MPARGSAASMRAPDDSAARPFPLLSELHARQSLIEAYRGPPEAAHARGRKRREVD